MTVSVFMSMSGSRVRVSAIVPVFVSVFLLMSVIVSIGVAASGQVSACDHVLSRVRVHVAVSATLFVVVPVMSSVCVWGHDHIFKSVAVQVAVCMLFVAVSMHDHASVRVNVRHCVIF